MYRTRSGIHLEDTVSIRAETVQSADCRETELRGSQVRILHNTRCCIGGAALHFTSLGQKSREGRGTCDDT